MMIQLGPRGNFIIIDLSREGRGGCLSKEASEDLGLAHKTQVMSRTNKVKVNGLQDGI